MRGIICYGCYFDYSTARHKTKASAGVRNTLAGFGMLMLPYRFGQGVEKNLETAVHWFAKAAELGYIIAHYSLAVCYHNGEGVAQDRDKAFEHFKAAAVGGDSDAQYRLASYYINGWGTQRDNMMAWEWFVKAAKQGNEDALRFVNKVLKSSDKD